MCAAVFDGCHAWDWEESYLFSSPKEDEDDDDDDADADAYANGTLLLLLFPPF